MIPASTYRLQLHAGFTFRDAAAVVPYLADLGITHLYVSPVTAAVGGSEHGYDMVDPTRLNPELGGEDGYRVLAAALRERGLGLVVDVVVNHMGIASAAENRYWRDVLTYGEESRWAPLFDVDWSAGRIVLPVLGDTFEASLELIEVDEASEEIVIGGMRLPVRPAGLAAWQKSPRDRDALRLLMDAQSYELADWRSGKQRVNYRRFFEIDDLIGIRPEHRPAFELIHGRLLQMVRDGEVDGLRIDHPDGLRDPAMYLDALTDLVGDECYVVVEKILAVGEPLREEWACDGTTGYDFMNEVTRVLSHPVGSEALADTASALTQSTETFEETADRCRQDVLAGPLAGQFRGHARSLGLAAGASSLDAFVNATLEVLARFDRYRTYHREDELDPLAVQTWARALARAVEDRVASAGTLREVERALVQPSEGAAREAMLRLQQIMPALQAKALEDRAFYQDRRFLPSNEVGGDPAVRTWDLATFHAHLAETQRAFPHRMLGTATHDHKRGEDARARLIALAECEDAWRELAPRAMQVLIDHAPGLDPSDAYLAIITALATVPFGMTPGHPDPEPLRRLEQYLVKALREAGERSSWLEPDEGYEEGLIQAVRQVIGASGSVLAVLGELPGRVAHLGALTSLAQLIVKMGAPGVVDVYQGNEGWDLSLVDPDNRRTPRYDESRALLAALEAGALGSEGALDPRIIAEWRDGRLKRWLTARSLRTRRAHSTLFLNGEYAPLAGEGRHADALLGFARMQGTQAAIVLAARFPASLLSDDSAFWTPNWADTSVALPGALGGSRFVDVLTGRAIEGERFALSAVLDDLPVALLVSQ